MNQTNMKFSLGAIALTLALSACVTRTEPDFATQRAREALTALQANPELASRVTPAAIADAERALDAAENPPNPGSAAHLGYLAERRVQIAQNMAMRRLSEDRYQSLLNERDLLAANAQRAAQAQADLARAEADRARMNARQLAMAQNENDALRREMAALNARKTDRGYVLTLGDVLFATAKSDIKAGAASNLDKLVDFLVKNPDRAVVIEGHTDNVGTDGYNQGLSQRRADAVRSYLVSKGVGTSQISAVGKGEEYPVAPNDDAAGRQQNRRIEVVIQNPQSAS